MSYKEFEVPEKNLLGSGCTLDALGVEEVHLQILSYAKKSIIYEVLYVPQLICNLFSVKIVASEGNFMSFDHSLCWIRGSDVKLNGMDTLL